MYPRNVIENLGHRNMSTQKLISLTFNSLEYMIKTFLTFSYSNHFRRRFVRYYYFAHSQKLTNREIISYLPEVLHPVNKLLLQHTVTFAQDY